MTAKKYSVFKNTPLHNKQKSGAVSEADRIKQLQERNDAKTLIQSIAAKLKDPELAKKAALIIEEMIQQDKSKK